MDSEEIVNNRLKLGILGGGQLGRMLIQAASNWDVHCEVLDPLADCPASALANKSVVGKFNDYQAVLDFGRSQDILTIEIENVNTEALIELRSMGKKVHPSPEIINLIKDKGIQKEFYIKHNLPTSEFILVSGLEEIRDKIQKGIIRTPFVQKLRREGYDGRGVSVINDEKDYEKLFDGASVIEHKVTIAKEISVVISRNETGEINVFPPVEMEFDHEANLVDMLIAPARISDELSRQVSDLGKRVVEAFELVGVLAVEMFLDKNGHILINEVAPRPHNSGHHTIEANHSSQYDQHLRAILGAPLGNNTEVKSAVMINLLGEKGFTGNVQYRGLEEVWKTGGAHLHIYGKKETKPFRKMGHITICGNNIDHLISEAKKLKKLVKVEGITKQN